MTEHSQWHYILGYLIVLTAHNWPIMLCLALGGWHAAHLYRRANPQDVRFLYGWSLLGLAYEYHKHLRGVFDAAVDFLLVWKFQQWNHWGHWVVAAVLPLIILAALRCLWSGWQLRQPVRFSKERATIGSPVADTGN